MGSPKGWPALFPERCRLGGASRAPRSLPEVQASRHKRPPSEEFGGVCYTWQSWDSATKLPGQELSPPGRSRSPEDTPLLLPNYLRFKETGQQVWGPGKAPSLSSPPASPGRGGLLRGGTGLPGLWDTWRPFIERPGWVSWVSGTPVSAGGGGGAGQGAESEGLGCPPSSQGVSGPLCPAGVILLRVCPGP